ncbi:MAG: C4-type zinc ribbon domain-containing protein [Nitrospirota bacterium]
MNEQLALLIRLQDLDTQLDANAEKRRQVPLLIEAATKPVEDATAELTKVKGDLDTLNRDRRDKEQDLKEREERIEKLKGRSGEIKSNKEYQAHLFEIELAQQEKGTVEERLIEMMDRAEALGRTIKEREDALAARKRDYEQERARIEAEQRAMEVETERLSADAKAVAAQLSPSNRQTYNHLKTTRKGLAVVPLKNGACQGCRLALPPQLIADLRKNDKLLTCTYCHRILFWPTPELASQKA